MPKQEIVKSKPFYRKSLFLASLVFGTLFAANLAVTIYFSYRITKNRLHEKFDEEYSIQEALWRQDYIEWWENHRPSIELFQYKEQLVGFEVIVNGKVQRRGTVVKSHFLDENGKIQKRFLPRGRDVGLYLSSRRKVDATGRVQIRETVLDERIGARQEFSIPPIMVGVDPVEIIEDQAQLLRSEFLPLLVLGPLVSLFLLVFSFLYVVRLIRQGQRLEAEAQMADRLAYIGSIASGLAHEIRNPLNAMAVNLQMLEEEIDPTETGDGSEARSLIGGAMNEVTRLNFLVTQFLDYARPAQPVLAESDCNEIVADTLDFLRGDLDAGRIEVRSRLDGWLPKVSIDSQQIRQALMNILLNARQVLSAGGQIEVSTRRGRDGAVRIAISDDGPGIAPEDREKIFQIFFSTRGGGTGMGLPIARKILENHGGSIEVDSHPGAGTTFTLILPPVSRRGGSGSPSVAAARLAGAAAKR